MGSAASNWSSKKIPITPYDPQHRVQTLVGLTAVDIVSVDSSMAAQTALKSGLERLAQRSPMGAVAQGAVVKAIAGSSSLRGLCADLNGIGLVKWLRTGNVIDLRPFREEGRGLADVQDCSIRCLASFGAVCDLSSAADTCASLLVDDLARSIARRIKSSDQTHIRDAPIKRGEFSRRFLFSIFDGAVIIATHESHDASFSSAAKSVEESKERSRLVLAFMFGVHPSRVVELGGYVDEAARSTHQNNLIQPVRQKGINASLYSSAGVMGQSFDFKILAVMMVIIALLYQFFIKASSSPSVVNEVAL